jgi:hypothetical protein
VGISAACLLLLQRRENRDFFRERIRGIVTPGQRVWTGRPDFGP